MDINFTFSDTIAGYVTDFSLREKKFKLKTSDDREFTITLMSNTYARFARNLGEGYQDATGQINHLLALPRQMVFAYGTFYPGNGNSIFEAQWLVFPGSGPGNYRHEEPNWWINQIDSIAHSYLKWQFNHPSDPINYKNYRTMLHLAGVKQGDYLQETDTISRLVYGFASAYLLTGKDEFLEGAEAGTNYLRDHMRFVDQDEDVVYWYHGVKVDATGDKETKLLTSEFGDDYDSIPMYEQIYALAGPTQTMRITGDPRIMSDIDKTLNLFEKFYKDKDGEGYY
jgi:hypothetical protein